ncbi:MAG: Uncharacterised protein [SAR116 cluster bacterium]|nr:MAG: Uncharacterised protein [SAR116 cluster bacterium]
MRVSKTFYSFFCAFFFLTYVGAQETTQTWKAVFTDLALDSVSSIRLETHYRTFDFFGERAQYIIRPSYTKKINPYIRLSAGYSFLGTTKGELSLDEHNIWEQIFYNIPLRKAIFFGWLRAEQRLMEQSSNEFTRGGRIRFRMGVRYPLAALTHGNLELMVFNEVFMITERSLPTTFNQNWNFFGFRIPLAPKTVLATGYQRITAGSGAEAVQKNLWSSILFVRI